MKKIFSVVVIVLMLSGCHVKPKPFIGYLVAKEYTPEHMCHDNVKTHSFAAAVIVPHVVHVPKHSHQKVEEQFVWYVANKNAVRKFRVSLEMFHTQKCGDIVILTTKY
jgi:PBP1b-binding outer membrane lipoprotein LpoB